MKVSASIEFVWQLASQETVAAEFKRIEPEHFFMAALKFSELPVEEVDKIAPGADVARELAAEVNSLRQRLQSKGIDSKRVRRKLRAEFGRGNHQYDKDEAIHRSQASRDMFDAAARIADEAGSEILMSVYLVDAMLASPTSVIEKVLGERLRPGLSRRSGTPLLDEYGRDLTAMAIGAKLPLDTSRLAECKVLMQALSGKDGKSVLLVTSDNNAAMATVTMVAQAIASKNCSMGLKNKRIVDVTSVKPDGKRAAQAIGLLEKLLAEAVTVGEVIVVVPAIKVIHQAGKDNRWFGLLRTVIERGSVQCICRVAPAAYDSLAKDRAWKRLAQVMWIEKEKEKEIPWEI